MLQEPPSSARPQPSRIGHLENHLTRAFPKLSPLQAQKQATWDSWPLLLLLLLLLPLRLL